MENNQKDLSSLVDDLNLIKKAITKSNNILKYIDVAGGLAMVGLWGGIITIILAGLSYLLINHFGSYPDIPTTYRIGLYLAIAASALIAGASKLRIFLGNARKLDRNITVDKLLDEIYTPQMLNIVIPFITAITVLVIFLITQDLTIYIVPALSVLVGLLCISYINIFYLRELLVFGDWLIATGLITLFAAQTVHPLLAVIFTFGLGLITVYVANRLFNR